MSVSQVSSTRTYGTIDANAINIDLPGIKFGANGLVKFELRNNKLYSISLFAQVEDVPIGEIDLDGFVDLKLTDFSLGAPGKVTLSAGIQNLALDLPAGNVTFSGEVRNLTTVPEYKPFSAAQYTDFGQWTANKDNLFTGIFDSSGNILTSTYKLLSGSNNQAIRVLHSEAIPAWAWSSLVVEFSASIIGTADAISFGVFNAAASIPDTTTDLGVGGTAGTKGTAHSVLFDFYGSNEIKVLNGTSLLNTTATPVAGDHKWRLEYSGSDHTNLTLRVFRDEQEVAVIPGVSVPASSRLMFGAGSGGASSNASITNFTVRGYGPLSGKYIPVGGKLFGSIDDLAIGNLFTAKGYAELGYKRLSANAAGLTTQEQIAGKAEVTSFKLQFPGQPTVQVGAISGSLSFELDNAYSYDNPYEPNPQITTTSTLKQFELKAGVTNLTPVPGITLSGSLSLEYQDSLYSQNSQGQSRYIFNVGIKNGSFVLPLTSTQSLNLSLIDAGLRDLIITADGVVQSWKLNAVVSQLNLFNVVQLSGALTLDYSRTAGSLTGSAIVNNFTISPDIDGFAPIELSGFFDFTLKDDDPTDGNDSLSLNSWSVKASVTDLQLGALQVDGDVSISALYNKDGGIGDRYTINAKVNDLTLDVGTNSDGTAKTVSVDGELRDLVIVDKRQGEKFEDSVRSWTLLTDELSVDLGTFSVQGSAAINYAKTESGGEVTKISASINTFTLPAALAPVTTTSSVQAQALPASTNTFSGSIKATLENNGAVTADLTAWELKAKVKDLALAGVTVSGSLLLHYSEKSATVDGVTKIYPYYALDASFSRLSLNLPGNLALLLSEGRFKADFLDSGFYSNPLFEGPEELLITAKVDQFLIAPGLSLSGAISLAYKDSTYRISGRVGSLALPGMPSTVSVGGSLSDLVIDRDGRILSWKISSYLNNINLFNIVTFTGQASVEYGYNPVTSNETTTLSLTSKALRFVLADAGVDLRMNGSLDLTILNGEVNKLALKSGSVRLKIFDFELNGSLDLEYSKSKINNIQLEKIRIANASVSADFLDGLVDTDLSIQNLILTNRNAQGWKADSWSATASVSFGAEAASTLPFSLAGNLKISYERLNSIYSDKPTYTLTGGVSEFGFDSDLLSLNSATLTLDQLVLVEGQIRALDLNAEIENLQIANLIQLSGDLDVQYFTDTGTQDDGKLQLTGAINDFKVRQENSFKSLFDVLNIESASLTGKLAGDDLSFTADVNFGEGITSIAGFQFQLKDSDATLKYDSKTNDLSLDGTRSEGVGNKLRLRP